MFGLNFFTRRRAQRATFAARAALAGAFAGQPPAERAAIMAVANAILASVAARHGDAVLLRPAALRKDEAAAIIAELSVSITKLSLSLDRLSDRDFGDPVLDGVHRQMRATELVVGTLGTALDPSGKRIVAEAWSALYGARRHAKAAVAALLAFQEETGISPVPEGVPSRPADLLAMATTAPPFLRGPDGRGMKLVRLAAAGVLAGTAAMGVVGAGLALALARQELPSLPDHGALRTYVPALASEIRASDGSLVARVADENRKFVPVASIPPLVAAAFLSAEDRNFRRHHGVDVSALVRAAMVKARGGPRQIGGSTITQQVVKNLLVGDERTLRRKIREAVVALRIERDLGKDRILEIYLNEVYLGSGAYGVAAAAESYFGKPLDRLDAGEAALLAGLPKAPTAADPRRHPARAKERRDYVLRRMAEDGVIDPAAARAFAARPVTVVRRAPAEDVRYGWFAAAARRSLSERLGPAVVGRGGLEVRTTLDPYLQDAAEEVLRRNLVLIDRRGGWRGPEERIRPPFVASAVPEEPPGAAPWRAGVVLDAGRSARILLRDGRTVELAPEGFAWTGRRAAAAFLAPGDVVLIDAGPKPSLQQMPDVEGGMAVLDPSSGNVLAVVGGWSRARSEFDRATQARRQPGSSFKTFVYLSAVSIGFDGSSPVLDVPIAIDQGPGRSWWRPSSESREAGMGLIPMRRALELSRNMASARLLNEVGLPAVETMLRRLGFDLPSPMPMSAALGTVETTPLAMAAGYAAIANGGTAVRPRFVASVASSGREVAQSAAWGGPGARVVDPVDAAIVADELQGVVLRGTARGAFAGFPDPVGGKTGTTNENKDAWFVAVAPNVVVATWIGRDDARPLPGGLGGHTAAPVAREFLDAVRSRLRPEPFPVPEGARIAVVDPNTGLPSKRGIEAVVRAATIPSEE